MKKVSLKNENHTLPDSILFNDKLKEKKILNDFTYSKISFQKLQEATNKYSQIVNSLPTGVYTCDKNGNINYYNDVAAQLRGLKPNFNNDSFKFTGWRKGRTNGKEVLPGESPMSITLKTGESFKNLEAVIVSADGSEINVCVNIDPLFDDQQNIIGAINIFQDTSNLKAAESALKESENRYHNLIQGLQTPLYTTDKEGRITLFNKAAADLWGREPQIGEDLWCGSFRILNTDGSELPLDECPMAITLKEARPVYGKEIIIIRPDGTQRIVSPHPQPFFDDEGNMSGAVNMLVDITDIKASERALQESETKYRRLSLSLEKDIEVQTADLKKKNEELKNSEERYHKMIEEVEDYAIILLDKNGIIQNWNKGAEKIKGYKEEEILGKSFTIFYSKKDQATGLANKLLNEAKVKGKAIHEGWRMRKDGTAFWGSIVLTALHDDHGNILGFSKVTRDLTERKLTEDKLKEYTSELEFQNKELEQFAYAASHDMKEPLRKIQFYNSFISERSSDQLDEKAKEYLSRSLSAAARMSNLIEDLLTYSRTTSQTDRFEETDLNEIVEEIAYHYKEDFDKKFVKINMGQLPVTRVVPFQIKQLFENLVSNSIKYKHPDRNAVIDITCELVRGSEINEKSAEPNDMFYKISVIDNGIGFEAKYSRKIFEIFQRLNNNSGTRGSGIGLAICNRIIQNHKGFIKATGKLNQGARFDIYLPANS